VKAAPFTYHSPQSVEEAIALLAEHGDDAKAIAGGQSLVPMMALRLARIGHLVDLAAIASLRGVLLDDDELFLGAMTTHREIEADATVAGVSPLLSRAAPYIGHFQIRNRGTIGGSCAHADPAAEWPAVMLTLGARSVVRGPGGEREVAAQDFFVSTFESALAADELLVGLRVPRWPRRSGFGIAEFARRHGDFAVAGATVGVSLEEGRVARIAIGLLGLGPVPLRASDAERQAMGEQIDSLDFAEVAEQAMTAAQPAEDIHGDARYRRRIGASTVRSALADAFKEAASV
jgi:aerobic carbon-monoxide dehydrogenase medium subunit